MKVKVRVRVEVRVSVRERGGLMGMKCVRVGEGKEGGG